VTVGVSEYGLIVYGTPWADKNNPQRTSIARLLAANEAVLPPRNSFEISDKTGPGINWTTLFDQHPGQYRPDFSIIRLMQANGTEVIGTIAINPLDETLLSVNWDQDTFPSDTLIDSDGLWLNEQGFDQTSARGNFDAIIDPLSVYPGHGMQNVVAGDRFLIVEDIGNPDPDHLYDAEAWGPLVAVANDIIEWDGSQWNVVFNSSQEVDRMAWQTNIYTGVQYMWNGISWVKSFEGEYRAGAWSLEL